MSSWDGKASRDSAEGPEPEDLPGWAKPADRSVRSAAQSGLVLAKWDAAAAAGLRSLARSLAGKLVRSVDLADALLAPAVAAKTLGDACLASRSVGIAAPGRGFHLAHRRAAAPARIGTRCAGQERLSCLVVH